MIVSWAGAVADARPETQYTAVGEADVAYQVLGDGPRDLLYFSGIGSHIELGWDDPAIADFLRRLASFSRLIYFNRRGTGMSDAVPHNAIPTWEEWTEDIDAVLDAVGSKQTAIFASREGGAISVLYTVAHPERVSALVLHNTAAKYLMADDYPIGASPEALDAVLEVMRTHWATPELSRLVLPDDDPARVEISAKIRRASVTPRSAVAQYNYMLRSVDVRWALPLIQVPTLVLHNRGQPFLPVEYGRYLADHISGARFVELPGPRTRLPADPTRLVDEIAEFLTGERPEVEINRILTTVLFTDIVGSTDRAASLGDERWRVLLDGHDRAVREQLRRFRGREINTTGDGFVACFDGPARAIRCAQAITEATSTLGVEMRTGLHTGECEVRGDDLGGLAVHIAARIGALATPDEVFTSGTVKDLVVGSGIEFADRGEHELKGVPGTWRLYRVVS
jgi:class 3 adenylate cyclase